MTFGLVGPVTIRSLAEIADLSGDSGMDGAATVQMTFGSKGHFDLTLLCELVDSLEPFLRLKRARP
ncbi:hypothetical protein [Ensifer sp. 4252]|uniref:hypothetical protein n=1 Tax=Ensifer sp. 4252 TaxID=3373915 RepID=UPI003D23053C